jgi:hypothetical protein
MHRASWGIVFDHQFYMSAASNAKKVISLVSGTGLCESIFRFVSYIVKDRLVVLSGFNEARAENLIQS